MEKSFVLKLTEDMVKEVQTLGTEVDTRAYVIDSMFDSHKADTDNAIFTSVPFQMYQKELFEYRQQYNAAVDKLAEEHIIPMVQEHLGVDSVDFDWKIENFADLDVLITLK